MKVFVQSVCPNCDGEGNFKNKYNRDYKIKIIECSYCDGKGFINEWIDIEKLKEALNKK